MNEYFFLFGIFLLFPFLIIVFVIIDTEREERRTAKLEPIAKTLGFQFVSEPESSYTKILSKFSLLKFCYLQWISNLMTIKQPGLEIILFDHLYYEGKFKRQQTVICFHLRQKRLPTFYLQPNLSPYKAMHWFKHNEVSFAQDRLFSKQYAVCGQDEAGIRDLFTKDLREFLKQNQGANMQVEEGYLIYFRRGVRVAPEKIFAFLDEGLGVLNLCLDAKPLLASPKDNNIVQHRQKFY